VGLVDFVVWLKIQRTTNTVGDRWRQFRWVVVFNVSGTGDLPRSLQEAVLRAAKADLRAARRYGEVGIAQTHHGLLNLGYERDARVYELQRFDGSGGVLARGPKRVVLPALIHSYVLVVASGKQQQF